jgi:RNA polymerase-binding transcription factor DksA
MATNPHTVLRVELQAERDRVQTELDRLAQGDFDEGFADSGQVTAERGEVEVLSGKLTDHLVEIDEALTKFDAGTYGECESCGAVIPEARLEAMPSARFCIACASQRH